MKFTRESFNEFIDKLTKKMLKSLTLMVALYAGMTMIRLEVLAVHAQIEQLEPVHEIHVITKTDIKEVEVLVQEIEPKDVTVEMVKEEIRKQSKLFGVDTDMALRLADCESDFRTLADNPKSTALGVYQYLIGTWEATESYRQGKSRADYKANIREAMIDIANGEHYQKWEESLACAGIKRP